MRWKPLAVGAGLALAILAPAGQVSAHPGLERSTPAANAVLEVGPPNIELDFNERVDAELASIELYDENATLIPIGAPASITDDTVLQASVPTLGDGVYVVVWRVPSADGHVVDGVFSFQVGVRSGVDVGALIDRVEVDGREIRICGRKDVLEQCVIGGARPTGVVCSSVRGWLGD